MTLTMLFQGIAYLLMMAVANVMYLLGPVTESLLRPKNRQQYRERCFALGFWFSVVLPFSIPLMIVISYWLS